MIPPLEWRSPYEETTYTLYFLLFITLTSSSATSRPPRTVETWSHHRRGALRPLTPTRETSRPSLLPILREAPSGTSKKQSATMNEPQWRVSEYGLELNGRECRITITPRPTYCDRGNYLAQLDAFGLLARDLDEADAWPRYYFDLDRAKAECEAWLKKRQQWFTE